MKKNETKNGNTRNQELTKQQAEDRVFNRMLLWLAGAVVVELIMLLFNRVYVHARVSELGVVPGWRSNKCYQGVVLSSTSLPCLLPRHLYRERHS